MNKPIFIISGIVVVGLTCLLFSIPVLFPPGAAVQAERAGKLQAQAGQPLATATLEPTSTPAATETPDVLALAQATQAKLAVELAEAQNTAVIARVTAETIRTQTAITETRVAADLHATSTATAARARETVVAQVATVSAQQTATVQAPITRKLEVQADWEPTWQMVEWLLFVSSVFLGMYLAIYLTKAKLDQIAEQRKHFRAVTSLTASTETTKPVAEEKRAEVPLTVTLVSRDGYGWGSVSWADLPIDRKTLRTVAEMVVSGARYTQAQMTGAEKPLAKGGSFEALGTWLCANRIAVQMADGRYVLSHVDFFEQVLA